MNGLQIGNDEYVKTEWINIFRKYQNGFDVADDKL